MWFCLNFCRHEGCLRSSLSTLGISRQTTKGNAFFSYSHRMLAKQTSLCLLFCSTSSLSTRKATEMETKSTTENMMVATETLKTCKDTAKRPQLVLKSVKGLNITSFYRSWNCYNYCYSQVRVIVIAILPSFIFFLIKDCCKLKLNLSNTTTISIPKMIILNNHVCINALN